MAMEQELREFIIASTNTLEEERGLIAEKEQNLKVREEKIREQMNKERRVLDETKKNIRDELNEDIEKRRNLLFSLLNTELEPVKKIAVLYFNQSSTDEYKKELNRDLEKIIKKINTTKVFSRIQTMVDSLNDGIVVKLKEDVPKLDERDIKFLTYELAGCTTNMTALLLDITPGYCRQIRRRLIEKIRKSGSQQAQDLLKRIFPNENQEKVKP